MKLSTLVPLFLSMLGCGITETGNPELVEVDVQMRTASSEPEVVALEPVTGRIGVAEAWLSIERIRFVRGQVCDAPGEEELDLVGPWIVDANAPLPQGITATLPAGDYCRVRVRLERAGDTGDAPEALSAHTVLLTGERGDGTPFEIRSRREEDADVRAASPISLEEATAKLAVALDVSTWLADVDLDAASVDQGVIRVDEDANTALLDAFEDRFEDALELFDDTDDD